MKGSHWFIVCIAVFLAVMFAVEYHLPKKFVWIPTFSHYDHQPFGCAVFDSVLVSSLPTGYTLSKKTFYKLEQEDSVGKRGYLVIAKDMFLGDVDVEAMLKMVERGNKVMLVGSSFSKILEDTLKFRCSYSSFSLKKLRNQVLTLKKDSIVWVGDSAVYPRQTYQYYSQFVGNHFKDCDSLPLRPLAEKDMTEGMGDAMADPDTMRIYKIYHPLTAFVRPWGKGELILVSTPLLFTNYGILDGKNATYLFRLLSQMRELPIVRMEAYMKATAQEEQSPFRFLLSQQPLRWALYLTMITILLFMLFTAKRRQRAIPVMREPENRSLEFTELIGTLYYQKKDHADLVRKKYVYFAEELRRDIQVDLEELTDDERSFSRIAQKTGMNIEEISHFVRELRPVIYGQAVTDVDMKRLIDKMNEIINHI